MTYYLIERVKIAKNSISTALKEDLINAGDIIVRPLIKLLPELRSYVVTSDIIEIIGQIGGQDSFNALSKLIDDAPQGNLPKRLISQSCIRGLSYIGDEQSIATIIHCLGYNDIELRYTAIDALSKLAYANPDHKSNIIKALQIAHANETFEKPGQLIEKTLEKLNIPVTKKDVWPNKKRFTNVIEPEINTTSSQAAPKRNIEPFQQIQPQPITKPNNQTSEFNIPVAQQAPIQALSSNKYAYLTEEEQKEILEKLLTSPEEEEKLTIINDLGKSGNTQVLDELLTVIKSSDSRKIQHAALDAILSIAPNDIKLRFLVLEYILDKRVIGQQEAKFALANALRVAQIGLQRGSSEKPIGSFLFVGPTGVGKTELAKALAEALYGNELQLIRIDMSEYTDLSDKNKLIGSPPGFAGCDEGGRLTQAVLNKPQSVVLFDEIEKAHPEIFNLFLQLLDDGRLTDSKGVTVSFKDTIILMTSNVGSSNIMDGLNAGLNVEEIKEIVQESLKTKFKPEFLNRLNDYIIFKPLTAEELLAVLNLKLKPTANTLLSKYQLSLEVCEKAKNYIIEQTQKQEFGFSPRELNRIIEEEIIQPLSKKLLDLEISENSMGKNAIPRGGKVLVNNANDKLTIEIVNPSEKEEK
ncbi:MAG: AAA family ATPase [Vampirovibrionia bacterium]